MLLLFCSQVLGTHQLIPTAQVNDISSTENGLTRKTFSNCNPWISSGWCDWHWTNAGRTRNLHNRSVFGDVKETQLTSVGRYIHPDQPMHRSIIWDWLHDKLIYEKAISYNFSLRGMISSLFPFFPISILLQKHAILLQSQSGNQRIITIWVGIKCMKWRAMWNRNANLLAFQKKTNKQNKTKPNLFSSTGNTMERKLASTLLGWAFTPICWPWLQL